jgi:hypothetical protein
LRCWKNHHPQPREREEFLNIEFFLEGEEEGWDFLEETTLRGSGSEKGE